MIPVAYNLRISDGSLALQKGLRIAAARKGMSVRDYVLCALYDALNRELGDMSPLWERVTYQDVWERHQTDRARRSAAARKAVMARWHPELRIAGLHPSEIHVEQSASFAPPRLIPKPAAKSQVRCPVNADHVAVRRTDGVWCPACERLFLLLER